MAKPSKKAPRVIHPDTVHVYVDGSYRPPNSAACAYLIFSEAKKEVFEKVAWAFRGHTINQMELMAINKALDHPDTDRCIIYCDSVYAISALSIWCWSWERRGWMSTVGKPVLNADLIRDTLAKIRSKTSVKFVKVKSHSGDTYNDMADFLATEITAKMIADPNFPDGKYATLEGRA